MSKNAETVFVDRSGWGRGPWDDEPMDKTNWIDPATDMDCMTVRNSGGAWCGYVGIPNDHPLYGASYNNKVIIEGDAAELSVSDKGIIPAFIAAMEYDKDNPDRTNLDAVIACHGGLNYADKCGGHICHVPEEGRPDDVWWFGFDCSHAGDFSPDHVKYKGYANGTYKTLDYVKRQCTALAAQLKSTTIQLDMAEQPE